MFTLPYILACCTSARNQCIMPPLPLPHSPCPKLKPVSKAGKSGFLQVGTQPYGGGLWHTWFDRDLGVAGRAIVSRGEGKFSHDLVRNETGHESQRDLAKGRGGDALSRVTYLMIQRRNLHTRFVITVSLPAERKGEASPGAHYNFVPSRPPPYIPSPIIATPGQQHTSLSGRFALVWSSLPVWQPSGLSPTPPPRPFPSQLKHKTVQTCEKG